MAHKRVKTTRINMPTDSEIVRAAAGESTAVEWPVGIGAKGNEGVANNVIQTKGAIAYIEYAYAEQNKLIYNHLIYKEGNRIAPSPSGPQPRLRIGRTRRDFVRSSPTSRAPAHGRWQHGFASSHRNRIEGLNIWKFCPLMEVHRDQET
jgi:hypothetical protein